MPDLTKQQELFCHEYLRDLNATQAAIRAGYSAKTANNQVGRLLVNVGIQDRLQQLFDKRTQKVDISAERVLEEVKRIAFADVNDAFKEDGGLKDIRDIPEDLRRGISSFEVEEIKEQGRVIGTLKKVKLWSKDKQLENLLKHLGLFEKDNSQTGKITVEVVNYANTV